MNAPLSPKQIEYWPLAQLKPYARNAKKKSDADRSATCIDNLRWESPQAEQHRSLRAARPWKSH